MNIHLLNHPFPHVVIYDFYNKRELEDIKLELKFLTKPDKLLPPGTMHGFGGPTDHRALLLEDTYANRKVSDILTIFKNKYTTELVDSIVKKFPEFIKLKHINSRITKVRYYHNNDSYPPHTDYTRDFLAFSYFHSQPRKFTGGEIHCTDYNYTLDCSDNVFVILPSYVKHEVLKVQIEDDAYFNGNGRYCVSQFLDVIPHQIDKKLA